MNVGIVLMKYNPFGGYERQAALVARALAGRGDSVTVFAGEWADEKTPGITFKKVPVVKIASWLKVLSFAFFSRRLVLAQRGRLDLVIAFDRSLVADIYRAGNACHREWTAFRKIHDGVKGRVSIALNPLHRVINFIEGRLFSLIEREGGRIVALSEAGAEQISAHYGVSPERFTIIPPAIDLNRLGATNRKEARKALGIDNDAVVLLHVGSGFRIKGLASTIRALASLSGRGAKAELLVAGSDRKETGRMKGLAAGLGVEKRVRFLGGVKEVGPLYAASDVFVLPSLFETFGVAAIEALNAGLPVVIGRGAGASGVIERFKAGRAVDVPADPENLADAIGEVYAAEKALESSGALDKERRRRTEAALGFSLGPVMEKFLFLIDTVARERPGKKPAK